MNIKTITRRTATAATGIIGITLLAFLSLAAVCVIAGMIGGIVDITTGHAPTATAQTTAPAPTPAPAAVDAPAGNGPMGCWTFQGRGVCGPIDAAPSGATLTTSTATPTTIIGCWEQPNPQMPGGYERVQGTLNTAPAGSVIADCPTN